MAGSRVTIIGIAPRKEGMLPFSTKTGSGERLVKLAGCQDYAELRKEYRLVNLSKKPLIGRRESGRISQEERQYLRRLAHEFALEDEGSYILCGTEVQRAFGERILPHGGIAARPGPLIWWKGRLGGEFALLPHTSGGSRFYNSYENVKRAEHFFKEIRERSAKGEWLTLQEIQTKQRYG